MPLVKLENGKAIEGEADLRSYVDAGDALPEEGGAILPLDRYLAEGRQGDAVRLAPEDDASRLMGALDTLGVIEVSFPKYVDGRGFSQAQLLRRRYGFKGEIRAVGEVLRDQIFQMARCGFNAFDFTPTSGDAAKTVSDAIGDFSNSYQPSSGAPRPVFALRQSAKT